MFDQQAYRRAYYLLNREKEAKGLRKWRKKNPERVKASAKRYREKHKNEIKAKRKARYLANRDKEIARHKAYRERKKRQKAEQNVSIEQLMQGVNYG